MKINGSQRISYSIITFFAAMLLFSVAVLACLRFTLFSENFMIHASHEANYSQLLKKEITEKIQDLGLGSNLPEETFDNVLTTKQVEANVDNYIMAIYTDVPYRLSGQKTLKTNMQQAIEAYAKTKKITISTKVQKDVDTLKTESVTDYGKYIKIPYFLEYGHKVMNYKGTLQVLLVVVVVVFLLVMGLFYWILAKWRHRFWRYTAYMFGGAALMLIALPAYILARGYIARIGILSKSIYTFLTTYITNFAWSFIYTGFAFIVIAIGCWLVSEGLRRKKIHRKN